MTDPKDALNSANALLSVPGYVHPSSETSESAKYAALLEAAQSAATWIAKVAESGSTRLLEASLDSGVASLSDDELLLVAQHPNTAYHPRALKAMRSGEHLTAALSLIDPSSEDDLVSATAIAENPFTPVNAIQQIFQVANIGMDTVTRVILSSETLDDALMLADSQNRHHYMSRSLMKADPGNAPWHAAVAKAMADRFVRDTDECRVLASEILHRLKAVDEDSDSAGKSEARSIIDRSRAIYGYRVSEYVSTLEILEPNMTDAQMLSACAHPHYLIRNFALEGIAQSRPSILPEAVSAYVSLPVRAGGDTLQILASNIDMVPLDVVRTFGPIENRTGMLALLHSDMPEEERAAHIKAMSVDTRIEVLFAYGEHSETLVRAFWRDRSARVQSAASEIGVRRFGEQLVDLLTFEEIKAATQYSLNMEFISAVLNAVEDDRERLELVRRALSKNKNHDGANVRALVVKMEECGSTLAIKRDIDRTIIERIIPSIDQLLNSDVLVDYFITHANDEYRMRLVESVRLDQSELVRLSTDPSDMVREKVSQQLLSAAMR